MRPLVSVLMPVYNCEQYVKQAIISVLSQSYSDFELLIIDDGSKDQSWKKICSVNDSRIRLFRFHKNKGNVAALNYIIQQAKGDYITLQDADDWSDSSRFEEQISFLEANPEVGLCGTGYRYAETTEKMDEPVLLPHTHGEILDYINKNKIPPVCCASMMFRRSVYEQTGFFREYFGRIGAADFDWYYRVLYKFQVSNISGTYYYYRKNPQSFTNSVTTNYLKRFSEEIAHFLYQQRVNRGYDAIDANKLFEIDIFLAPYVEAYRKDNSLIYREAAKSYILKKQWYRSFIKAMQAICKQPVNIENYKLLRYWFWKTVGI